MNLQTELPHTANILDDFVVAPEQNDYSNDLLQTAVRIILSEIGEDPNRQGLIKTPDRVSRMYEELTSGYRTDAVKLINGALFDVEYDGMVLVNNIEFYSMCEHHMLPFFGKAYVAYIPKDKVIGLSKIPRIVEMFARRLQVQERMTNEIAQFLQEAVDAKGVAVFVEGSHLCGMMRGVKKSDAKMTTTAYLGAFNEDPQLKSEFLSQVNGCRIDR